MGSLRGTQDIGDRRGQAVPRRALLRELLATDSGERVEPGFSPGLGCRPFSAHPAALLQPVQRWIQGALLYLKHVA